MEPKQQDRVRHLHGEIVESENVSAGLKVLIFQSGSITCGGKCQRAALMTGTTVEVTDICGDANIIGNDALAPVAQWKA
jgi:hypothetical protein